MLLRKLIWAGLYALTVFVAQKIATRVFKIVAGEEPPARR